MCSKSPNASRCSTIWQTHAVRKWCRILGLATIHFDQCELGQCVAKSTVLATDLPLRHWTGMTCAHGSHQKPSGVTSGDLSRYPPLMMRGLAQSILTHTSSQFGPPPIEDRAHSLQSSGVSLFRGHWLVSGSVVKSLYLYYPLFLFFTICFTQKMGWFFALRTKT